MGWGERKIRRNRGKDERKTYFEIEFFDEGEISIDEFLYWINQDGISGGFAAQKICIGARCSIEQLFELEKRCRKREDDDERKSLWRLLGERVGDHPVGREHSPVGIRIVTSQLEGISKNWAFKVLRKDCEKLAITVFWNFSTLLFS